MVHVHETKFFECAVKRWCNRFSKKSGKYLDISRRLSTLLKYCSNDSSKRYQGKDNNRKFYRSEKAPDFVNKSLFFFSQCSALLYKSIKKNLHNFTIKKLKKSLLVME